VIASLLGGVVLALALVAALLFFRAYRRTRDRLFLLFGIAFVIIALERALLAIVSHPEANEPMDFVPRLVAFGIILYAIIDRNRR
jgi:Ca2+/Na+ antiporter